MWPVLIARRYGALIARFVHPDYIVHNLFTNPVISSHHVAEGHNADTIIVAVDLPEFLTHNRRILTIGGSRKTSLSDVVGLIADEFYNACDDVGTEWTFITGMDALLHRLGEAIDAEMFFD